MSKVAGKKAKDSKGASIKSDYMATHEQVRERLARRRRELIVRREQLEHQECVANGSQPLETAARSLESQDDEVRETLLHSATQEISDIDEAMERLVQGTYGVCKHCDEPIAPLRLANLPQAVTCAACPP